MRIAVVGSGYVGLVVGTCFADNGNDVTCVDVDKAKIDKLTKGISPIYEPGLEELLKRNIEEGRLKFTTNLDDAVKNSLVVFIAVGTPPGDDGSADLKYVLAAARGIGRAMDGFRIIVDKSTVPVGTSRKVAAAIREVTEHPFGVVSNPEFLKEGDALDDFLKPDRVVIGTDDPAVAEIMKELYSPFLRTGKPLLIMDPESAELTKYAANAMLATRISFMNEIAAICDKVGADVSKVREGIATDSRIGASFLFAGLGYGGSCFPKDVQAIVKTAEEHGYDFKIVKAVEDVNQNQRMRMLEKIKKHFHNDLKGKTIAVWGLAFKPNTDDMREAPSVTIIDEMLKCGAKVRATDPESIGVAKAYFKDRVEFLAKPYDTLPGADALVVVTEWNEFRRPDFEKMKSLMRHAVIFDGRNIYTPAVLEKVGFHYYGIGIKSPSAKKI
ncbi:MAG: UDP-glucose/GDP-mannose dehydrogenase family protein [Planctomycetes bacterium]|nr:UDP-glucose/GDP-mannose dehydrogenase family protein [Planctomycetota bacterium]